jgi:hypothetical protein
VELGSVSHSEMMSSFDKFVQAHADQDDAAQVNAMAVQSFPPLPMFTGEDIDSDEKRFDKWLERFKEQASLACWTDEQRFHQFKFHLDKSALHVFRLLPESERGAAVAALKKRFKPIDIEKLWSLEFHQKMQDQESVEKLGLDLQQLAQKQGHRKQFHTCTAILATPTPTIYACTEKALTLRALSRSSSFIVLH